MLKRFSIYQLLAVLAFGFVLSACSSGDNTNADTTKAVFDMPAAALSVPGTGTLSAYVIVDGNISSPVAMTINTSAGTASASIPGLSRSTHNIQIVYEYTNGSTSYIVAQSAVHNVDLSGGSASFDVPATDYNAPGCALDTSLLGYCAL